MTRWMRDHPHLTGLLGMAGLFCLAILVAFAIVGYQAWNVGCRGGM